MLFHCMPAIIHQYVSISFNRPCAVVTMTTCVQLKIVPVHVSISCMDHSCLYTLELEQFMLYICMYRSHMYRSHMYRSHMYRSHMYRSHMYRSHMYRSHMYRSHMYRSHMYGSHMYGSHMYRSHMYGSYMYIFACIGISYTLSRCAPAKNTVFLCCSTAGQDVTYLYPDNHSLFTVSVYGLV